MNYPLISEYIEAIKSAEDNFEELSCLRPVLGNDGLPVMTSGNFAVVFKMKDEQSGKFYAVKCFTKEQEGRAEAYREIAKELKDVSSPYLASIRYMEKELFVDTDQTAETEFPVLLMDWVEGKTLDKYLRENLDDKYALEMLAYRFSQLAQWLIPQPFAHGDLKPDNILVREDGTLVLVDYDGMYVPTMKGQKARELGSPDFRHPQRTANDFNECIDDFSLVSILLSLKILSINPSLLFEYGADDRLLFSYKDYVNITTSSLMHHISYLIAVNEIALLYSIFIMIVSQQKLFKFVDGLLQYLRCELTLSGMLFYTRVSQFERLNLEYNKKCVKYSNDNKRLICASNINGLYEICSGTETICNDAFSPIYTRGNHIDVIVIPNSVKLIGRNPFAISVTDIICNSPRFKYENSALYTENMELLIGFYGNEKIEHFEVPEGVKYIGGYAFAFKEHLKSISLPSTLVQIGEFSFDSCKRLTELNLPQNLKYIGEGAFCGCSKLDSIIIPERVETIGDRAFFGCPLYTLTIPKSVVSIGANPFLYNDNITVNCKSNLYEISNNALYSKNKKTLISCFSKEQAFTIPKEVTCIGSYSFNGCLCRELYIHDNIKYIGSNAFDGLCYEAFTPNEYVMKILVSKGRAKWAQKRIECGMVVEEVEAPPSTYNNR